MRKLLLSLAFLFIMSHLTFSQPPNGFSYQSIMRDNNGNVISNQETRVRISLLQGSITGTSVYVETHLVQTNNYGIIDLNIGEGIVTYGNFSSINWGETEIFVKIEIDPNGGYSYSLSSTSQLMSVPYAIYAKNTEVTRSLEDITEYNKLSFNDDLLRLQLDNKECMTMNGERINLINSKLNLFIGNNAGKNNQALRNLFIGEDSGLENTTGHHNVFLGLQNGSSTTTGSLNTFLGCYSGRANVEGEGNVYIGYASGIVNTGGSNVYIGNSSGYRATTGSGNIFIGNKAGYSELGSNKLYIDNSGTTEPLIYGEFDNNKIIINGSLGINVEPNEKLSVKGNLSLAEQVNSPSNTSGYGKLFVGTDGNLYFINDEGQKTNLTPTNIQTSSTKVTGHFQFVTYKQGSKEPIAFGTITDEGEVYSSSGNVTCEWDNDFHRYLITISSYNYYYLTYTTIVTPIKDNVKVSTNSIGGKLIVEIWE